MVIAVLSAVRAQVVRLELPSTTTRLFRADGVFLGLFALAVMTRPGMRAVFVRLASLGRPPDRDADR